MQVTNVGSDALSTFGGTSPAADKHSYDDQAHGEQQDGQARAGLMAFSRILPSIVLAALRGILIRYEVLAAKFLQ